MRKSLTIVVFLLIVMSLACTLPQPSSTPPSPIATEAAVEVVPTEKETKSEPTLDLTSTNTPFPVCTPPACAADEVYYCPGECPGGCGTGCATPTPVPDAGSIPPQIISFTADRASIVQGENVNVTWQATGGAEAGITWLGSGGVMDGLGSINPNGGTVSIAPQGGPVTLKVTNSAGAVEAVLNLTIECAQAWVPELASNPPGGCPFAADNTWAAQQPFENGFMIWMESIQSIYVFYDNYGGQSYRLYPDTFKEGDPENDPNLTPPPGLYQPVRGFGLIWRSNPEVRDHLGWATATETGFNTWQQSYQGFGMHNLTTWLKGIDGAIYRLTPMGSVWSVYAP